MSDPTARGADSTTEIVEALRTGSVEVLGLIPYASNYTFLARVGETSRLAVYKPTRGERPLWDFPRGTLAARETAAFVVSEAGGWRIVPPTVLRDDCPHGRGSLQLFIEHDPERHFFALEEQRRDDFRPFATFDAVVNNADRKAGHVLEGRDGRLWAIDHGVTFHSEPKLRTVIWAFAEDELPDDERARLVALRDALAGPNGLVAALQDLLTSDEVEALAARVEGLLARGRYPRPEGSHPLPWPLV